MWKVLDSCKYRLCIEKWEFSWEELLLSVNCLHQRIYENQIITLRFCLDPPFTKLLKPYFIDVFIQGRLKVKHIEISVITQRRNGVAAMKRTHGCHNIKPVDSDKWDQGLNGPIQITVKWNTIISTERTARYMRRGTCMTKYYTAELPTISGRSTTFKQVKRVAKVAC